MELSPEPMLVMATWHAHVCMPNHYVIEFYSTCCQSGVRLELAN